MSNKKKAYIRDVKRSAEAKKESNDKAYKKIMAQAGQHACKWCKPWKDDNKVAKTPKRSAKKPKYKDKR